jgi:hypothetical protein
MNRWSIIARLLLSAAVASYPGAAKAHTFVVPYTLPVPFWLYLYACAATVAVTFAAVTYFAGVPAPRSTQRTINLFLSGRLAAITTLWGLQLLRAGAVGCLALTVLAGLIGTASPLANINMTLFWILFLLGFTYLTALIGNLYEIVNPWNVMTTWAEVCGLDLSTARLTYPEWLGYYPACLFYIALIWIELFLLPKPLTLSLVLIGYSLFTFSGAWLFGSTAWFGRAELFSVFFRLVSVLGHAVMPGAAVGFLYAGPSPEWLSLGGLASGLAVAALAGLIISGLARRDAGLVAFYLVALSLGVVLVAWRGSNVDVMRVLFGTVLAIDQRALLQIAIVTT